MCTAHTNEIKCIILGFNMYVFKNAYNNDELRRMAPWELIIISARARVNGI